MARGDAWSAGALALLAVFAITQALRLDAGSVTRPGPGFFPLVLGAALAVVAVGLLARAMRRAHGAAPREPREATAPGRLVATVAALIVYVAIFERIGFIVATFAMLAFLFGALGRYRWPVAVAAALGVTLAAWLLFDTWLHVRLPAGVLGRW